MQPLKFQLGIKGDSSRVDACVRKTKIKGRKVIIKASESDATACGQRHHC
ncbi:hypothetical protein Syun_025728 [Stephania yunnanensis]|uniref:Uncharacterized protein n=1 Tax=Stephania yunnanensis TaxID=152371 RepID=A0AAP0HRJ0_9MAGN